MLRALHQALLILRRHPAITVTSTLTLAAGIGVNAVMFSVLDAAILRPLPYAEPARLVNVYRTGQSVDGSRIQGLQITKNLVRVVRGFTEIFEDVEVVRRPSSQTLVEGVDEEVALGGFGVGLPALLGVQPQAGRSFDLRDVATQEAIVLSDRFWERRYARDRGAIGRHLRFPDHTYVVIGVMPPTFRHFMGEADAWIAVGDREGSDLAARLRPGLSVAQAQRRLDQVVGQLPRGPVPLELQIVPAGWQRSVNLPPGFVSRVPWTMLVSLMGGTAFVLLIASANVGNLLLARTVDRHGEIATRSALGATRGQLFRQFLMEGMLLAATGGLAAMGVAWVGIRLVPTIVPADLAPLLMGAWLPEFNGRVLAFGLVGVLVAGVASSAAPAFRASWKPRRVASGGPTATASRALRNVRRLFQGLQIALTVALLVGGGLFGRSLLGMFMVPPGFEPANLVFAELSFPTRSYPERARKLAFLDELVSRAATIPGVSGVTLGQPPVDGVGGSRGRLVPDGEATRALLANARRYYVAPTYFGVAGIALRRGRSFGDGDNGSAPEVVIVSENIAARLWPQRDPIGRRLTFLRDEWSYTVVGVVPDLKTVGFVSDSVELFFPIAQTAEAPPGLLMRMASPFDASRAIRAYAHELDPDVILTRIGTVDHLFKEADPLGQSRFYAVLFGMLATTGLLTAAVGLHGLMAVSVSQRLHEIGVRVALGANRWAISRLILWDASIPVVGGLLVGLLTAFWLSRVLASQLFHMTSHDPTTFGATAVFVLLVAALALVVPVRRACQVTPSDALRRE